MAVPDSFDTCGNLCTEVKVLGDMSRLRIISLLANDTTGTLGVVELAATLGISRPAVSQHLKVIKGERIVESERVGFHVYFTFNRERVAQIAGIFDKVRSSVLDRCDQQMVREEIRDLCDVQQQSWGMPPYPAKIA